MPCSPRAFPLFSKYNWLNTMTDESYLYPFSSSSAQEPCECHIVFIHGLDGHAKDTWQTPKPNATQRLLYWIRKAFGRSKNNPTNDSHFWPAWIAGEFPQARVWSLGYPASSTAWTGHAMSLPARAKDILRLFELNHVGTQPLILIVHSLGGLVAKQLLRTALTHNDSKWEEIGKSVAGILFLATPHSGSSLVSFVNLFRGISRPNSTMENLRPDEPYLLDLNEWFRKNFAHFDLSAQVLSETKTTCGVLVVNQSSADPGIPSVRVIPVDKNHITICKPASTDDRVYLETRRFIADRINEPRNKHTWCKNTYSPKSPQLTSSDASLIQQTFNDFQDHIDSFPNDDRVLMCYIADRFAKSEPMASILKSDSIPWNGLSYSQRVRLYNATLEKLRELFVWRKSSMTTASEHLQLIIDRIDNMQ
jgi:pimeloyl-ACP methyl ester carboxylesterase